MYINWQFLFFELFVGVNMKILKKSNLFIYFFILIFVLNPQIIFSKSTSILDVEKLAKQFINAHHTDSRLTKGMTYSISGIKQLPGEEINIGYVVDLIPHGFIVFSSDNLIEPIIAYSFDDSFPYETSELNIFLNMVTADLENRKLFYTTAESLASDISQLNQSKWNAYSYYDVNRDIYGPLLMTSWEQRGHFDDYCPIDPSVQDRSLAGCVAIAIAQILNYWKFPTSIYMDEYTDDYSYINENIIINIPEDAGQYSFPTFAEVNNQLSNISYNENETEEGYLCFAVGVKQEMTYGYNGSGAYPSSTIYREIGYGSASRSPWSLEVKDKIIENIIFGMPAQLSIRSTDNPLSGHAIVVDGYNEGDGTFHVNMGWGGQGNAWYSFPNITNSYNIINAAVHDINPEQGWNQWGANALNNKRTPYVMPIVDDIRWTVSCDTEHSFDGIIVGTSGQIITTCSYLSTSSTYPPSVWFIRDDGIVIDEIFLNQETESLVYPAQNSNGDVYIATDSGNLYRINKEDHSVHHIFSEPNGEQFSRPVKVDEEGYLYIATFYDLYCLNPSGNIAWSYHNPGNSWDDMRIPAVDVANNHVFHSYYNFDEDRSYLICFNRQNGNIITIKTFYNIPSLYYSTSIPSVDSDGVVYVGVNGLLYALNPFNSLSTIWEYDAGLGRIRNAPAIGRDGTLYFSYWENASSLVMASIDPDNGNDNWNMQISTNQDHGIHDIYVDFFNNICFALNISGDPDTWQVHSYKDLGSSAQFQWMHDFGTSAGSFAFGPERTMYVIPTSGNGHTITAISDSEIGGMGWDNNDAPIISDNPLPLNNSLINSTPVTLSWNCFDPNGNALLYSIFFGTSSTMMIPIAENYTQSSFEIIEQLDSDTTYIWKIIATDGQASTEGPTWAFQTGTLKIKDDFGIPLEYRLHQNYPNPFNPLTTLRYDLQENGFVNITVYDILGREVKTLVNQTQEAGYKTIIWNATNDHGKPVSAGVYLYQIQAAEFVQTKKMVLLK